MDRNLGLWGLGLLILALESVIHPYLGIVHDAGLYSLLALARLHPALQHDFFVALAPQDHYTVFAPLYAAIIQVFGLNRAAALLVLVTQALFFAAAWFLVRRVTSADKALLGLGLLVVLPTWYGANMAFYHQEMFPTPRQPAEALVLLGMGYALSGRRWIAAACLVASALLHPIIAGAGILFWIVLELALPHPRAAVLAGLGAAVLCVLLAILPHGPLPHFDSDWLNDLTHRQNYLFPTRWTARDWTRSLPGPVTLLVGAAFAPDGTARRLCRASLVTVVTGLALAVIGGDLLQVTLVTQLQMWRWLWLSGVLAGLLLPVTVISAWEASITGRAAAVAVAACWLAAQPIVVFSTAALICVCTAASFAGKSTTRAPRYFLAAACAVLALGTGYLLLDGYHLAETIKTLPSAGSHFANRVGQLRVVVADAPLCAVLLAALWYAVRTTPSCHRSVLAFGVTACLVMLPYAWVTWSRTDHPASSTAEFEAWRRIIPEGEEVLWPDSPPLTLWYSLQRASYFSPVQLAGMVFSRQSWEIGTARERAVLGYLPLLGGVVSGAPPGMTMTLPPRITFNLICHGRGPGFFASWRDLGPSPYPMLTRLRPMTGRPETLRLYHCDPGA